MPFAPKIHKDILAALEEYILPALQTQRVTQLLAEPPFDFDGIVNEIARKGWLVGKSFAPLQTDVVWKKQYVMATNSLRVMFVFRGTCATRIGITQNAARKLQPARKKELGGVNQLTLKAPAILCHPAFSIHSTGADRPHELVRQRGVLYYKVTKTDVRIQLSVCDEKETTTTHNLEINDDELTKLASLYLEKLRRGDLEDAQALQLVLMLRLRECLLHSNAIISNSCSVTPPLISAKAEKVLSPVHLQLCQELTEYVISHLHAPLTLRNLADRFNVSTVHLNYVFKQARGTTVMRFVTQMRIEAAKAIITKTPERINDVAQLVGFSSLASFSTVFQRYTGQSPNKYRKIRASKRII